MEDITGQILTRGRSPVKKKIENLIQVKLQPIPNSLGIFCREIKTDLINLYFIANLVNLF